MENCCTLSEDNIRVIELDGAEKPREQSQLSLEERAVKFFSKFPSIGFEWLHYKM